MNLQVYVRIFFCALRYDYTKLFQLLPLCRRVETAEMGTTTLPWRLLPI